MTFCHKCGKKKEQAGHKLCGYCGTTYVTEQATVRSTVRCICDDCFLWCDPNCRRCHPPEKSVQAWRNDYP